MGQLDAVELAKNSSVNFRVKVACAHLEMKGVADLNRFAALGVIASYTLW